MFSTEDADQGRKCASVPRSCLSHEGQDAFESPTHHLSASLHGEAPLKASTTDTVKMGTTEEWKIEGINESSSRGRGGSVHLRGNRCEPTAGAGVSRSITMSPCQNHREEKCQRAESGVSGYRLPEPCPALPCLALPGGSGREAEGEGRKDVQASLSDAVAL